MYKASFSSSSSFPAKAISSTRGFMQSKNSVTVNVFFYVVANTIHLLMAYARDYEANMLLITV